MKVKVALIGAGAMGGAIGTRLAQTGNTLTVFDLNKQMVDALVAKAAERGLRWVDSPLSGGAPKALTGELTLMAGGADADV